MVQEEGAREQLKQEKSTEVFVDNYSKKVQLRTKLNTIYGLLAAKGSLQR